jgi:hypothetical protein
MRRRTFTATLHHLIVALLVGGDEDNLSSKALPSVLEKLDSIGPSSSFLRIPEDHPLRLDMFVNEPADRWPEGLLLIRSYPDEKPNMMLVGRG